MMAFKPPRQSAFKRYATDPMMYLIIALVVIGVSITTLYKKDKTDLAQRVKFLKGTLQIASTNGHDAKKEAVAEQETPPAAAAEAASPAPVASVATTAAPATPAATASVASGTTTAYIYYAEVPRRALERLYEESQATGQFNSFGDYTAGILPDVQKRITAEGLKIRILEKSEKTITKNQQWFTGLHDNELDEDMGLSTFVELAETDSNVFRGNLEIVRTLRETDTDKRALAAVDATAAAPAPQKNSYPAIFEMGPGSGFFIAGVLPRKTRIAHEEELSRKGPFEVLRSPAFQNKETEFVIFIEFEKKP
ncbi:MAG: hypothetical protein JSU04_07325 [Bdellovibrionales bacterium]|nr:hypothetical protein [Bdellovibrionales bacterium]